jgi:bifunctional non-homologous end joining protein LigD
MRADSSLKTYRSKRKFAVTPEPRGHVGRGEGQQFVIQKHAARRLHYDLRLELGGVMKSWAVSRGPSLVPGEKRLAVQVEDHPIEYNTFEGSIPQGEYGGGTVLIWDRGRWFPEGDPVRGLEKGHLDFALEGEKLHGRWHLVRMRRGPRETKDNWLFIKAHDEWERSPKDLDILEEEPRSVASGRSIEEIAQGKGKTRVWHSNRSVAENVKEERAARKRRGVAPRQARPSHSAAGTPKSPAIEKKPRAAKPPQAPLPDFIPPSLATLSTAPPSGSGWVHEIKFDGYRIQARLDHGEVRLLTRKGLDWTKKFPNVADAVAKLNAKTALLDGEVVVEDERGASSSDLQAALKQGERNRFIYYVFDLLHLNGRDLTGLPLSERKAELQRLLGARKGTGPIRYSEHFDKDGSVVLDQACRMTLEGIVSKRADAPYRSGRSDAFIKTKCSSAQEFVVGGYSPSTAMPKAIGALVVGYYEGDRLIYAGRIGTGYTHAIARDLWNALHPLEIAKPAFHQFPATLRRRRDILWVEPKLVIEAHLRGWTADGLVRQAAFKGVREDKPPREVVRERPAALNSTTKPARRKPTGRVAAQASKVATKRSRPAAKPARQSPARSAPAAPGTAKSWRDGDVRFTHPDRVYWVDVGVTKQNLADYYAGVWDWMAPHVIGRPLALVRCPDGTKGECFFQKHASAGLTERNLRIITDRNSRQVLAVENLDGLLSLVQAGVLEVHVRGSRIDSLDCCDRIVFDLDPGEGVDWRQIVQAAREVRERLASLKLESFIKLSGGKGLHVVAPIEGSGWDETKRFVQAFAFAMAADDPDRYVAKMTKSIRDGKIFVDYMRNSLEQTSVAAYSTRARSGAPVSAPVSWQELGRTTGANQYTLLNLTAHLRDRKQDPWKDKDGVRQRLPDLRS